MKIALITPAPPRSRAGNRATAARWRRILSHLGHRVDVSVDYDGTAADLMVALHAWRSADAVTAFSERFPRRPLVVALTGTDLYRFIHSHPQSTLRSIELADRLVTLHALAHEAIPVHAWAKVRTIYQSAVRLPAPRSPFRRHFEVCVAGHLRDEKDPLRAAYAVRVLPDESRLRVRHYGKPHDEAWAGRAREEMARNFRYRWYGEIPHWRLRQVYRRCHLMVLSSRMEGGANVISEAVVAGLPVVASRIPGSVGLLGDDYPGYYPPEDHDALREVLLRAERDAVFYAGLEAACAARRHLFDPARESADWAALLEELG